MSISDGGRQIKEMWEYREESVSEEVKQGRQFRTFGSWDKSPAWSMTSERTTSHFAHSVIRA
jgi:hypothetical protein